MLRIKLVIVLIFVALQLHAGNLKKAYVSLERKDYKKAHELLEKLIRKDSLNPCTYLLNSILYSSPDYEAYSLEKAYDYTLLSLKTYDNSSKRKMMKFTSLHPVHEIFEEEFSKKTIYIYKDYLDKLCFEEIKKKSNLAAYQKYISRHEGSVYLAQATQDRDRLAFEEASKANTWQAFQNFLNNYPQALERTEARIKYERLFYEDKTKENSWQSFQKFISEHPKSPFKEEAEMQYQLLFYKDFTAAGTMQVYQQFYEQFPGSFYAGMAKEAYEKEYYLEFTQNKTPEAYKEYIEKYPDSRFVADARTQMQRGEFEKLAAENNYLSYLEFFLSHPESPFAAEAREKYDQLLYESFTKDKTYQSYKNFYINYPYSPFAEQSKRNHDKALFNATVVNAADIRGYQKFLKICENKNSPFYVYAERYIYEISTRERTIEAYEAFVENNPDNSYIAAAAYRIKEIPAELEKERRLLAMTQKKPVEARKAPAALPRTLGHKKGHNFKLQVATTTKDNCEINAHLTKAEAENEERSFANGSGETFSVLRFQGDACDKGSVWLITRTNESRGSYKVQDGSIYLDFVNGNIYKCAFNSDGTISVLNLSKERGNNIFLPFDHAPLPNQLMTSK